MIMKMTQLKTYKLKNLILIILIALRYVSFAQTEHNFLETKDAYFGLTPPDLIPEFFAPGIVSDTSWSEHCQVAISPKGDEIYWSRFAMVLVSKSISLNL